MTTAEIEKVRARLLAQQRAQGVELNGDIPKDPWEPRWRLDAGWVEFECGCRAERCQVLHGARKYDPIIFRDLEQQAVYDFVCDRHAAGMNDYVHFGGFVDFPQWKRARRAILMGKVEH